MSSTFGGYRLNIESWHNTAVFALDICEGFHAGFETYAAIIDLEAAYNKVLFHFLLFQLMELNIHPVLVNWISVILYQRKVILISSSWAVDLTTNTPGLPQASPLSMAIFIVYTVWIIGEQLDGLGGGEPFLMLKTFCYTYKGKTQPRLFRNNHTAYQPGAVSKGNS